MDNIQISRDRYLVIDDEKSSDLTAMLIRNDGFEAVYLCGEDLGKNFKAMEGKTVNAYVWNRETEQVEEEFKNIEITLVEVEYPLEGCMTVRVCGGPSERTNLSVTNLSKVVFDLKDEVRKLNQSFKIKAEDLKSVFED